MNNKNKGFTLIELLAVIVLLAIVGIVGANLIITRLNKAKVDTMMTDFKDLQKEIAYKMMNDDICGEQEFTTEAEFKNGVDGIGWYYVYNCTKYYDISSTDYNVFLGYSTKRYQIDGVTEYKKGDSGYAWSYYTNKTTNKKVLMRKVASNPYKYVDNNGNEYDEAALKNFKKELDTSLLYVELSTKGSGKFKNVSFTNEDRKKICEGYTKGSCGTSSKTDRKAYIVAKKEL